MDLDLTPVRSLLADGTVRYRTFVHGGWSDAKDGATLDVRDPQDGTVFARVPRLTPAEVEAAVETAVASKRRIRDLAAIDRIGILDRAADLMVDHADELAALLVQEAGKPVSVAKGEVKASWERLRLTLEEARVLHGDYIPGDWVKDTAGKFAIVRREPRGVVATICPYNYPLFTAVSKIAPALVAGNTVVAKPATQTPVSLLHFARLLEVAGLPQGAFQVVTGRGSSVGEALASHAKVDMITFTGSTEVGERIASLAPTKKLNLELGGKGAAIVLDDANLDLAAREVARGGLRFSGQRCDAVDRIFVQGDVGDAFVAKLLAEVAKYKVGDPREAATQVGPLIDEGAVRFVHGLVEDAVAKGAKVLVGGSPVDSRHYPATVLDGVTREMRVAREESFGPLLPIMRRATIEAILLEANESEYALDSCVFTNDINKAFGIARRLEDGEVTINGAPAHGVGHFPFGGNKRSGLGREGIGQSIEEMTRTQTIVFNMPPMDKPFAW